MADAVMRPVAAILSIECATVLVLVAPLPVAVRRSLVKMMERVPAQVGSAGKWAVGAFAAGWLFTLQDALFMPGKSDDTDGLASLMHDVRQLRAQRSSALCGCALLLMLVIHRLYSLLKESNQLSGSCDALKRQAESASAAYKALSAEKDALEKSGKAMPSSPAAPAEAPKREEPKPATEVEEELAEAKATIDKLRERTQVLLKDRDAAIKDAEALKRQAEGISAEYARLTTQKESLENKLADYELVLGEQVKKSK